jgi:type I restriction enzyme S subunit
MNRIQELLVKLSPGGVPFVTLGEVAQIQTGKAFDKTKLGGPYSVWNGGVSSNQFLAESNTAGDTVTIPARGSVGVVGYQYQDFWCGPLCYRIRFLDNNHSNRYLYFYLKSIEPNIKILQQSGSIPALNKKELESVRIPIPPIEIQHEIVKILDTMTELQVELEEELEARKRQFNYLKTKLIGNYAENCSFVPLGSLITHLRTGLNPRQNFVLNPPGAACAYITVRELDGFKIQPTEKTDRVDANGFDAIQNRSRLQAGDVLFSATGTIGRTALVEETPTNWGIKEGVYAISTDSTQLDPRFLIYLFGHSSIYDEIIARSEGSTVRSISMASLKSLQVPLLPLPVQKRITDILDVAYALTFESLPSETNARRKQYEYYRKRLLTFNDVDVA